MRKSEILFEAITNLRDDFIEAAQTHRFTKKRAKKTNAKQPSDRASYPAVLLWIQTPIPTGCL